MSACAASERSRGIAVAILRSATSRSAIGTCSGTSRPWTIIDPNSTMNGIALPLSNVIRSPVAAADPSIGDRVRMGNAGQTVALNCLSDRRVAPHSRAEDFCDCESSIPD